MIVKEEFLSRLRKIFGLNLYEVKVWTALLSRGTSTAGELSNISEVPRSRTYDILESLEKKGFIVVDASSATEDQLMDVAVGAGAEDLSTSDDIFEIITAPHDFMTVREALEKANIALKSSELTMIPKNEVSVSSENARSVLRLIETLEDHDDVQNVYANADIPDNVIKELA